MVGDNRLEEIVGKDNVVGSSGVLEEFSSDLSFVPRVTPRCVVRPGNALEVQQVVRWANDTGTPLVPVSSGAPHFRGDTVPREGGAVIVDLHRMKKVIRLDTRNRVAMIEPGVTFAQLQEEAGKAGLAAYTPLCPRGNKSVLSSMLEREPVTMPAHHWDSTDPFLCGEIIFGNGDILRSGEAAGPETTDQMVYQMKKSPMTSFGLSQFDENKLISGAQGTIGIVTWATMKCRMVSKFSRTMLVPSAKIEPLLGLAGKVLRTRQCDHLFIVNGLNLASLLAADPARIKELRDILPPWVLAVSFEGNGELPEEKAAWQEADFRDLVTRTGSLSLCEAIPGATGEELGRILAGPSTEPYWKQRFKGGCSELFFLSTLNKTPQFIDAFAGLAQSRGHAVNDVGVYIQPIVHGTSCHCEFDIFHDPAGSAECERAKWLLSEGAAELANKGAFFSRPYGPWAKTAYSRATGTATMQRKLKKIFDPNNVLNPGQLCF